MILVKIIWNVPYIMKIPLNLLRMFFFNLHHNFEDYDERLSIDGNTDGLDNL